jgi:hypothetical protein
MPCELDEATIVREGGLILEDALVSLCVREFLVARWAHKAELLQFLRQSKQAEEPFLCSNVETSVEGIISCTTYSGSLAWSWSS